jgi:hypothetical protein
MAVSAPSMIIRKKYLCLVIDQYDFPGAKDRIFEIRCIYKMKDLIIDLKQTPLLNYTIRTVKL